MVWRLPARDTKNPVNKPQINADLKRRSAPIRVLLSANPRYMFAPIENAPVNVKAKMVASIRLKVIDDGIKEIFVNTAVTKWPK